MTAPHQSAPDGAYIVDSGGGEYNYGQGLTEKSAAGLMLGGVTQIANPFTMLTTLTSSLHQLPLEVLQLFGPMIPLANLVEGAFETVSGAVGSIISFFSTLAPVVLGQLEDFLKKLINAILAPLGGEDAFDNIAQAFAQLTDYINAPFHFLGNFADAVEDLFDRLTGKVASLDAQINAIRLSLDPTITDATGGYDNCKTTAHFESVIGTLNATGWGAVRSHNVSVSNFDKSPLTDRHGAGITVKAKRVGRCSVDICSDVDRTNFVRLLITTTYNGKDTVSVVTGTGPDSGIVVRKSIELRAASDTFWEIRYEPYDEESETSNTFHVFQNGQPVLDLRWADDGNAVIHGADHREVGVLSDDGFAITDFTFYDWKAASPE